jgi:hypothetical protein
MKANSDLAMSFHIYSYNPLAELIFLCPSGQDIGREKTKQNLDFSAVGTR